ncbi:sensor histidine kinase RegB [Pseudooceanicola sp.]|uniref:sensor histidine kinase RegB n=1 Tax=Pseudooceanicola sp. TaxID=1914328 RepID=UPI0026112775|nr:ActS/PrrB/RegB family redox-sensitive histidine kinase [Pseudooceanicola sp.]MDF1854930.1 ActS/PrrB/RegB family redox-sensitive histidine kinase [Pseudooceanicola sp.]
MSHTDFGLLKGQQRGNWIRLRTIILLRWGAIVGQLSALIMSAQIYHLQQEYALCFLVVGVSVLGNLIATLGFPENKRLTEAENLMMVLFDLLQLTLLLYLTGGLNNPFSILIVGPVTISAAALSLRSTVFVGAAAIIAVTLLVPFHLHLLTETGAVLRVADLFLFGNWLAIVIAVIFLGVYSRWIAAEMHNMSDALQATQMALAREQKLTDLGGVVAAAAHELGTPLATIKLTASELIADLAENPELQDDARLIGEQADRCRDILRSMGRAGKEDLHLLQAPVTAVVQEAAEPHLTRGKTLHFDEGPMPGHDGAQPVIRRQPEIIHGLRNLIQNAVDFARANIWIETRWGDDTITVRIMDDGRGYSPQVIGRIGDPFVRRRRGSGDTGQRPEYEGMGLGLFIAKTLLERSGAELSFANGPDKYSASGEFADRSGAVIEVVWPRGLIVPPAKSGDQRLGQNRRIEA